MGTLWFIVSAIDSRVFSFGGKVKVQAIISKNPMAKFYGLPDKIETYDITCVTDNLKDLYKLAQIVDSKAEEFCEAAQIMSVLILQINKTVRP